ncbi:MAG TPA: SDR family oxidoreductase [Xanthomonadales bacterium]|nr:SDR family oxidoreductase [Xanthomonadales bacterium]
MPVSKEGRFAGESVFVTGAGSSVGRVMAQGFATEGARVHICDVLEKPLRETLDANPGMCGSIANVGNPAEVAQMFAEARAWMGDVTILVNTVGIGGPRAPVEEISDADWQESMAINVSGMFHCIREVVPAMKQARHGAIINFSSGSTRTGLPFRTPYVVSKYAVEGLTRNLARELGPDNIRVNAILPGMIDNERMRGIVRRTAEAQGRQPEQVQADYLRYISMQTMISPVEISDMVLFLASGAARHVTGQLIGVDGNVEWEF